MSGRGPALQRIVVGLLALGATVLVSTGTPLASERAWNKKMGAAGQAMGREDWSKAERLARKALEQAEAYGGSDRIGASLGMLLSIQGSQDQWDEADETARRALAVLERPEGFDGYLGAAFSDVGAYFLSSGRFRRALSALDRAIGHNERAGGQRRSRRFIVMNLAMAHDHLGNDDEAERYYKDARFLALDPYMETMARLGLGEVQARQGRHDEAARAVDDALGTVAELLHPDDPSGAFAYRIAGRVSAAAGEALDAETSFRRALELRTGVGRSLETALAMEDLGRLLLEQGRLEEAEPLLEEAVAIREVRGHRQDGRLGAALVDLGRLRGEQDRVEEALSLYARGVTMLAASLGEDHPSVGRERAAAARLAQVPAGPVPAGGGDEEAAGLAGTGAESAAPSPAREPGSASSRRAAIERHVAFLAAVRDGDLPEAARLLDEGVDPDQGDHDGVTPLMLACDRGDRPFTSLLLGRGADVNLARRGDGRTPLIVAASMGHEDVVELLLAHEDIRVDEPDHGGVTPLMYAAYFSHAGSVELLIAHGADVNVVDDEGFTPLGVADGRRIKKLLRAAGAR